MPSTKTAQTVTIPVATGFHATGRLMTLNGSGECEFAGAADPVIGVLIDISKADNAGESRAGRVAYSGVVTAELGDALGVGVDVGPNISGLGTLGNASTTGAIGILLKSGNPGDIVPVLLKTINS